MATDNIFTNTSRQTNSDRTHAFAIPEYGLCATCLNRAKCETKTRFVKVCANPKRVPGSPHYRKDDAAVAAVRRIQKEAAKKAIGKLKRVKRNQVKICIRPSCTVCDFTPLPRAVRDRNSRGGKFVRIGNEYRKHCEQCGAKFSAATEHRRLCDACHDEICEYLGVNYGGMFIEHKKKKMED